MFSFYHREVLEDVTDGDDEIIKYLMNYYDNQNLNYLLSELRKLSKRQKYKDIASKKANLIFLLSKILDHE